MCITEQYYEVLRKEEKKKKGGGILDKYLRRKGSISYSVCD